MQYITSECFTVNLYRTAKCLLMNYVQLVPGIPTRLHFTDDYIVTRTIAEKESGKPKLITARVYQVDELEGEDVNRTLSVMSQKLQAHLEPYLKEKLYTSYDFIITKIGDGFLADFNVQPIKRAEA